MFRHGKKALHRHKLQRNSPQTRAGIKFFFKYIYFLCRNVEILFCLCLFVCLFVRLFACFCAYTEVGQALYGTDLFCLVS